MDYSCSRVLHFSFFIINVEWVRVIVLCDRQDSHNYIYFQLWQEKGMTNSSLCAFDCSLEIITTVPEKILSRLISMAVCAEFNKTVEKRECKMSVQVSRYNIKRRPNNAESVIQQVDHSTRGGED